MTNSTSNLQAVIFDMDGLLIDSEPFWHSAHIAALAKHGLTITDDDVRQMAGKRTDEVVQHWRKMYNLLSVDNDKLEAEVVNAVITNIKQSGAALPGVKQLIALLELRSIPLAVASSSAPDIIDAVLVKLDLARHFAVTYSAKHEAYGKPHPGVFLTTAQKLNVEPNKCLVFEDALSGVRAAKAAGMICVAVPEVANLHKPEFQEANLVIPSLELVSWQMLNSLSH